MNGKTLFRLDWIIATFFCLLMACNTSVDDSEPEVSENTVKIGLLAPITGPLAGFGQDMVNTARMAADEINRAGGVNGQPIGFLVRDSRLGRPDSTSVSQAMTQELVDAGVVSIIGPAGSGTTLSISNIAIANGVPIISPSATSPALTTIDDSNLIWRTVASDAFQGIFLAEQLRQDGIDSIAVIYRNDAYGEGLSQTLIQAFSETGGIVTNNLSYPQNKSTEFDAEVSQLLEGQRPDAIVVISFVIDGANIMVSLANLNDSNLPALYGVDGNNRPELIENSPPKIIKGMRGSSPTAPSNLMNYTLFNQLFNQNFNKAPPIFTETTYDAVYLLALAMSVAGENSSSAIVNNLGAVSRPDTELSVIVNAGASGYQTAMNHLSSDIDFNGASGLINFDANGDVTSGNYIIWEIVERNGELAFETVLEAAFP